MSEFLRRRKAETAAPHLEVSEQDRWWVAEYPALAEHLGCPRWPDGAVRETTTILLFVEAGAWKACINDRAEGMVAFVAAGGPRTLLERVEKGLVEGTLDWRPQRRGRRQ
jgi:hypothetical protein